jgi:hypothetical protein
MARRAAFDEDKRVIRGVTLLLSLLALILPGQALAVGGDYVFEGATPAERSTVKAALNASAFDWSIVPAQVTIHVGSYDASHAKRGHIFLDRKLLASGRFAWATVMDEYAHQVDFFVLDPERRAVLQNALGASLWCYEIAGSTHNANGCERFSSMIAWAYWPSRENSYRPASKRDESAAMAPAKFRTLMSTLVGAPTAVSALQLRP